MKNKHIDLKRNPTNLIKKKKNYPYTESILSSLFPPVLYTSNFTSNACFCIGDAINPGQRFKTRLPLSSDLKTVYVPEASRRSVSVADRPGHPPIGRLFLATNNWFIYFSFLPTFSYFLLPASPLPLFFPNHRKRGVAYRRREERSVGRAERTPDVVPREIRGRNNYRISTVDKLHGQPATF